MTGQVIVIKPQFTDTAGGVTAGETVFTDQTNGFYADEYSTVSIGTGDAGTLTFTATLNSVRADTLTILVNDVSMGTDDGAGNLTGAGITTGTIDYTTGALSVTFVAAPGLALAVTGTYNANSEIDADAIRELDLGLNVISVSATAHPLRLTWSVQAQLAATASIGLDVEDTATVIAGQLLKIERDRQIITYIANLAGAVKTDLIFSAAAVTGLARREVFNDFIITVNDCGQVIFDASGKGTVAWIIAGSKAATVMSSMRDFVREPNVTPIGAHLIGSLNGVQIIKDPYLTTNEFIAGYNGILPGDSGVIVADWIPVYFTPTEQTADLVSRKGLLSMYDIVNNVSTYYTRGRITNI